MKKYPATFRKLAMEVVEGVVEELLVGEVEVGMEL